MSEREKRSSIERIDSGKPRTSLRCESLDGRSSSLVANHDVTLSEYLRNAEQTESLRQRLASLPEIYTSLRERNTALQVSRSAMHVSEECLIS